MEIILITKKKNKFFILFLIDFYKRSTIIKYSFNKAIEACKKLHNDNMSFMKIIKNNWICIKFNE
jgi:hypothetical protein